MLRFTTNRAWLVSYLQRIARAKRIGDVVVAKIQLSGSRTLPEDADIGDPVGTASVSNGSGPYTYAITADPDNKFDIDTNTGEVTTTAVLDYEAATSHGLTIEADNGVDDPISRAFTITVTNVLEAGTLVDLELSDDLITQGASTTITVANELAGSSFSIFAGALPAGLTINAGTGTITGTPTTLETASFTIRETNADAVGNPHDTVLSIEVEEAPAETFVVLMSHGDSRTVGVFAKEAGDVDIADVSQYVLEDQGSPGNVQGGYALTLGLTSTLFPQQQAIGYNGTVYLSPIIGAAQRIKDAGFKVTFSGGGWNGAKVAGDGHILGPLPDGVTANNILKGEEMLAARAAASPTAELLPVIITIDTTNDGGTDPEVLLAAKLQQLIDLRTATGFEDAPVVVVSTTPEHVTAGGPGGALVEAANRLSALKTAGAVYCQLPSGLGNLHEGEDGSNGGAGDIQLVRDAGYDWYGRSILVSLGEIAGEDSIITIEDNAEVGDGSADEIEIDYDVPAYFTVDAGSTGLVELSDDLEYPKQKVRAAGGTWAFTDGDPQAYTLNYRNADGVTGSITRHIVVLEGAAAPDDPNDIFGANLVGWYEAADLADGAVSSWANKAATGIAGALAQATSGKRPVKAAASFNGLPGITFDGSDDILVATLTGISASTSISVFLAVEPLGGSGTRLVSLNKAASNDYDSPGFIPILDSSSGKFGAYLGGSFVLAEVSVSDNAPHTLFSVVNKDGSPAHQMFVDGTGGSTAGFVYPAFAPTVLTIGGSETPADFIAVRIAEVIVAKNDPSSAQVAAAQAWLEYQHNL